MSVSHGQIKKKLEEITKKQNPDPEVVNKCFEIAINLGLAVDELGNRWEAYAINKKMTDTAPTMKELQKFSDGKTNCKK